MADFGDALRVAWRRYGGTKGSADDWLEDESGNGAGVIVLEKIFEVVGAGETAIGIGAVKFAVIAEAWSDVAPFCEQGLIGRAASDVAADAHSTKRAAVITLPPRDDAEAFRIA